MIISLPQGFDRQKFYLPGQMENMGGGAWEWRPAENVVIGLTVDQAGISLADDTEQTYVDILQAALTGAAATEPTWGPVYWQVKKAAQSAVGVALTDLTNAQIKALLAVLLFDRKAVDTAGKVRPLAEWIKRRAE